MIFLKFIVKKVPCALGHIFSKVNRGIIKKSDAVGGTELAW